MEKREKYRQRVMRKLEQSGSKEDLALKEIVIRANMGECWGSGEEVLIGKANNIGEFSTLFFHEAAHKLFGFQENIEDEERCYVFSKEQCLKLGLPYIESLERFAMSFLRLTKQFSGNQETVVTAVNNIPMRIRRILSLDSDQVV